MECKNCGKNILTPELEKTIAADQSIDAGEFSGSHDYNLCECPENEEVL